MKHSLSYGHRSCYNISQQCFCIGNSAIWKCIMVERVTLHIDIVERLFHMLTGILHKPWGKPNLQISGIKSSNSARLAANKTAWRPDEYMYVMSICNPSCHEQKCIVTFSDGKTSPLANSPCAISHSKSKRHKARNQARPSGSGQRYRRPKLTLWILYRTSGASDL